MGGLRDGGFSKSQDIWGKRPFSSVFWISQVLFAPSGKGWKRQKKGEKGRLRPISRKGGQTPLKPPFVTPLSAAAQLVNQRVFRTGFRDLRRPGLSESCFWKCSFGLVHGQFLPFSVVVHLPKFDSQCEEPCENYKTEKSCGNGWLFWLVSRCLFLASRSSFRYRDLFDLQCTGCRGPKKHARVDPRKKTISMPNNRVQNLDTPKKISTQKRRLRPPWHHRKDISIPKKSCRRCLRLLVLEPQTDHAESCEIMADHAKSCPWKCPWFCLKVPDFAWKCLILFSENGCESAWCPESPRTVQETYICFQWTKPYVTKVPFEKPRSSYCLTL